MAKVTKKNDVKKKETTNKVVKKETKKKVKKEGFFKGIKKELSIVKWPTLKEIVKYTLATIIFCIVFVAFFEALNVIMAFIKELFN